MLFQSQRIIENARAGIAKSAGEPIWVRMYDSTSDVSDAWGEEFDPENERGDAAIAYFRHDYNADLYDDNLGETYAGEDVALMGVAVHGNGAVTYFHGPNIPDDLKQRIEDAQRSSVNGV